MSISEVTERVSQLGNAWEQFKQVNDARLREIETKGNADPLYTEHLSKINHTLDQCRDRVDRLETAVHRPGLSIQGPGAKSQPPSEYCKAFNGYLRKGSEAGLSHLQTKALSVGSDPDGGYLVTEQMSELIVRKIYESSPIRQLATVEAISTDALDVIEDTGDAGAAWTTETGAVSESSSPQIGKNSISVHEMYAQPKATQKLVDDASINIEQWIAEKVADKFSRLEAAAFISGTGNGQPKGILSYTAGTSWGEIEQIDSGTDGAVTADSLIQLFYALNEEYARNATFLMNRSVLQSVRLLKEATTNQYLWQPGLAAGAPDTLLGVPVAQAADMPVATNDSFSVAVADFRRAYLVVDRVGLRILRDPFTEKPFIKFYTTRRVGGEVVNFDAIKLLKLTS